MERRSRDVRVNCWLEERMEESKKRERKKEIKTNARKNSNRTKRYDVTIFGIIAGRKDVTE